MITDGYADMSIYIFRRIKRETMYAKLVSSHSKYAVLYQGDYPKANNAFSIWLKKMGEPDYSEANSHPCLSYDESSAIVNWVYRALKKAAEREAFITELFNNIDELHGLKYNIRLFRGVVYNASKVEIHILKSISSINQFISTLEAKSDNLFFRGHANPNYFLCPSILRTQHLAESESKLYNELLINCPKDFENCHSHLEKLVKMQHYGLPTRLLDITRNVLVALYFACESDQNSYGELIIISTEHCAIKYPQSDTVSILASLPAFSYEKQLEYAKLAQDSNISDLLFNCKVDRLLHEVRLEKPSFQSDIKKSDLISNCIVHALKSNNRIVKQDGAFILCGLTTNNGSLNDFRYCENNKRIIVLIDQKKKILEQLETFSINRATLFPEIECVAEYLKNKYS